MERGCIPKAIELDRLIRGANAHDEKSEWKLLLGEQVWSSFVKKRRYLLGRSTLEQDFQATMERVKTRQEFARRIRDFIYQLAATTTDLAKIEVIGKALRYCADSNGLHPLVTRDDLIANEFYKLAAACGFDILEMNDWLYELVDTQYKRQVEQIWREKSQEAVRALLSLILMTQPRTGDLAVLGHPRLRFPSWWNLVVALYIPWPLKREFCDVPQLSDWDAVLLEIEQTLSRAYDSPQEQLAVAARLLAVAIDVGIEPNHPELEPLKELVTRLKRQLLPAEG